MLIGISKAVRLRLASLLMAMYALCVLVPSVAVAFNGAPCVNETAGMMQAHQHIASSAHEHAALHEDGSDHHKGNSTDQGKCCGAMFFSAIAPSFELTLTPTVLKISTFVGVNASFDGLVPDKLIRPPKSLS